MRCVDCLEWSCGAHCAQTMNLISLTRRHQLPRTLDRDDYLYAFQHAVLRSLSMSEAVSRPPIERRQSTSLTSSALHSDGLPPPWPPTVERRHRIVAEPCAISEGTDGETIDLDVHDVYLLIGTTPTEGTPADSLILPPSPERLLQTFLDLQDRYGLTVGGRALAKHANRSDVSLARSS